MKKHRDAILDQLFGECRGKQARLAALLGITPQALSKWPKVPAERVLQFEQATGIPRERIRPDIYGAPLPDAGISAEDFFA